MCIKNNAFGPLLSQHLRLNLGHSLSDPHSLGDPKVARVEDIVRSTKSVVEE